MSGRPFVYFPHGIPAPRTQREKYDLDARESYLHACRLNSRLLEPEVPCLWSPGLDLSTRVIQRIADAPNAANEPQAEDVYYVRRDSWGPYKHQLPDYEAWLRGDWFPIPAKK
jgi:hypothetical protein